MRGKTDVHFARRIIQSAMLIKRLQIKHLQIKHHNLTRQGRGITTDQVIDFP